MYKYIKPSDTKPIFAMSFRRKEAINKITAHNDQILWHLCECIIYGNSLGYLDHWLAEISSWIVNISKVKVKGSRTTKFTEQEYADEIFSTLGEDDNDAEVNLDNFKIQKQGKYPDFEITDEMKSDFVRLSNNIRVNISKMLAESGSSPLTFADVKHIVKTCYNDRK